MYSVGVVKLRVRLHRVKGNIFSRCTYKHCHGYKNYGGRGIKALISTDELEMLWHKYGAAAMKYPSIDRIDNNGHYIYQNCQFIEMKDNIKKMWDESGRRKIQKVRVGPNTIVAYINGREAYHARCKQVGRPIKAKQRFKNIYFCDSCSGCIKELYKSSYRLKRKFNSIGQ